MIDLPEDTNEITELIKAEVSPFDELETVFQSMLGGMSIYTAVGATLDLIGKLVGVSRAGVDDDTYRRYIRAQISTNKSNGRITDLITIADLIVFDDDARMVISQPGRATVVLRVADVALGFDIALILISFLRRAVAAGVRIILETLSVAPAQGFRFAKLDFSPPDEGLGFESFDETTGGALASALE